MLMLRWLRPKLQSFRGGAAKNTAGCKELAANPAAKLNDFVFMQTLDHATRLSDARNQDQAILAESMTALKSVIERSQFLDNLG